VGNGGVIQRYYALVVQPWEIKVAWGDEFDIRETDAGSLRVSSVKRQETAVAEYQEPKEEPKEEQLLDLDRFDEGENMYMEWQPNFDVMGLPALLERFSNPPLPEREPFMISRLQAHRKSSFWKEVQGELPTVSIHQLRSKHHQSSAVSYANHAILTMVSMVEDGPRYYRMAMVSDESELGFVTGPRCRGAGTK